MSSVSAHWDGRVVPGGAVLMLPMPTGDVFLLQTRDKRNPLVYAAFSTSR